MFESEANPSIQLIVDYELEVFYCYFMDFDSFPALTADVTVHDSNTAAIEVPFTKPTVSSGCFLGNDAYLSAMLVGGVSYADTALEFIAVTSDIGIYPNEQKMIVSKTTNFLLADWANKFGGQEIIFNLNFHAKYENESIERTMFIKTVYQRVKIRVTKNCITDVFDRARVESVVASALPHNDTKFYVGDLLSNSSVYNINWAPLITNSYTCGENQKVEIAVKDESSN